MIVRFWFFLSYLITTVIIVISVMFTFYFCPKLQDKHCREHYDYDRENSIQIPSLRVWYLEPLLIKVLNCFYFFIKGHPQELERKKSLRAKTVQIMKHQDLLKYQTMGAQTTTKISYSNTNYDN